MRNLARLKSDGSLYAEWSAEGVPGPVHALAIDEGRLYVGGDFAWPDNEERRNPVALSRSDATLDEGWLPVGPQNPSILLLDDALHRHRGSILGF